MHSRVSKIVSLFKDYNSFNITPDSERDTLIDLEFISRINTGQKINVRHRFLQNDGIVTSFSRTFWHIDNKDNTLSFCDSTIRKTINIIRLCEADMIRYKEQTNEYNKLYSKVRHIFKLLCKAIIGINNLQLTYTGNDRFISQTKILITEINAEIEPRLSIFFPEGADHMNEPLTPTFYSSIDNNNPPMLNMDSPTRTDSNSRIKSPFTS